MTADRRTGRDRRTNAYCLGSCACQGGARTETCRLTHAPLGCARCNPSGWRQEPRYGFALVASMGPLSGVAA